MTNRALVTVCHCDITDVKECAVGNGGCSQRCVEEFGSFHCECLPGYVLQPDGVGCLGTYISFINNYLIFEEPCGRQAFPMQFC